MRILIADHDAESRKALRDLLSVAPDITVVAECGDGRQILRALADSEAHLVFVDAAIPYLSEFYAAFASLDNDRTHIVGVVADETSAVHALEQGAADIVLKPVSARATNRLLIRMRYLRSHDGHSLPASRRGSLSLPEFTQTLRSAVEHVFGQENANGSGKLPVKVGTHIRLLKLAHIMYVRAAGDYIDLTMSSGERIHTKEQLAHLVTRLPAQQFVRTHRSFILNREYVKEIRAKNNDYELVMNDDTITTSGSTFRKQVRQQFLLSVVS
jgi:two-component system LytT family response regulator